MEVSSGSQAVRVPAPVLKAVAQLVIVGSKRHSMQRRRRQQYATEQIETAKAPKARRLNALRSWRLGGAPRVPPVCYVLRIQGNQKSNSKIPC